ncbi:hypothetical protein ABE28_015950 [Peribacillus muralis]|uniref:Transposase for insertion sequence element IS21-like C-terminal domain-containing protein n=1 Tax=Peribacillus muralis TaxID=264697 RepID=A0A1B3XRJ9_9BACI|nr:hypothetical protein [Peribacillus muralis]AOH55855.1 hypothetical protein ABE28_015950 [Peribacillus muralis]
MKRTVLYVKNNFFQRKHEPTLYALNHDIRIWLDHTANQKKNQTTNETPVQRLQHEQKFLRSWGIKSLFPTSHWEMREVSRDYFISYLGKKYSVPFRYAGQKVKVKVTLDHQIEMYDEQECIAQHPILTSKTKVYVKQEHYEGMQEIEKEQELTNPPGLAAKNSVQVPTPMVETRSLAS